MPAVEVTSLLQRAVLWVNSFTYDAHGQEIYGSPIELKVRWIDTEPNAISPEENQIDLSQLVVVDRYIPPKSRMWLDPYAKPNSPFWRAAGGAVNDWLTKGINLVPNNLTWVRESTNTPDVKAKFYFRTVKLQRLSDTLNVG